jgi:ketosteroid isomerase-like protein
MVRSDDGAMTERTQIERIIGDLHAARIRGDLAGLCALLADDGVFEITGASADKPIAIRAVGLQAFRPWLAMMTKVFRISDYALLSLVVEGNRATAHWRAGILSKVTGVTVTTELVDLLEIRAGKIKTYTEFFVPR